MTDESTNIFFFIQNNIKQHKTTIKIMSLDQKLHKLRVKQQVKQRFKKR